MSLRTRIKRLEAHARRRALAVLRREMETWTDEELDARRAENAPLIAADFGMTVEAWRALPLLQQRALLRDDLT